MISMLFKEQEKNGELTNYDIRSEFWIIYAAGQETTAVMLSMALYELGKNPQYLKDLSKEYHEIYSKAEKLTTDVI